MADVGSLGWCCRLWHGSAAYCGGLSKLKIVVNEFSKRPYFVFVAMLVLVYLKNSWIADDAFILLRSLDNLTNGYGPVWNIHERVQVYTSAAWYWLLAFASLLMPVSVWMLLFVGFLLFLCLLKAIVWCLGDIYKFIFFSLFFVSSPAVFDFTSSGLENILLYFLLVLLMGVVYRISNDGVASNKLLIVGFIVGCIMIVRHDVVTLIGPAVVYVMARNQPVLGRNNVLIFVLSVSPILTFSMFSLFYYGFPFPNTAYAKLNTGIDRLALINQGMAYVYNLLKFDPLAFCALILSLVVLMRSSRAIDVCIGFGVLINIFYVVFVGGDFMSGRFFSASVLVAYLTLINRVDGKVLRRVARSNRSMAIMFFGLFAYNILMSTPLFSPVGYNEKRVDLFGIADERGYYGDDHSLYSLLTDYSLGRNVPSNVMCEKGRTEHNKLVVEPVIGSFGYCLGDNRSVVVVDDLALSDPFLARLPSLDQWRIGHFPRCIPNGYFESLISGANHLSDSHLRQLYADIRLATQSDNLWAKERWLAIARLNLDSKQYSPISECDDRVRLSY